MLSVEDFDEPDEPPELDEIYEYEVGDEESGEGDDMVLDDSSDEEEFVEFDPSGRYGRYSEVLGKGAMKTVYRAYDMKDCKEVAWNKARLLVECSDEQAVAVQHEIHILEGLHHQSILKLYNAWVDDVNGNTNFITELCSTTLLEYRLKHKHISRKAVKSWGRQILEGLAHLHMQDPPIIHRDLKCENIFVKCRSNTALKIGDFGSATFLDETRHMHTLVGTPEFMAPEMFQEDYNELVDIYSFGMCMLELLTRECPYSECKSLGQIYKKVVNGEKPKALYKVMDMQALRLIKRCLLPAFKRPSASELLADPFLQCQQGCTCSGQSMKPSTSMPNLRALTSNIGVKNMLSGQSVIKKLASRAAATRRVERVESVDRDLSLTDTKDHVCRKAFCTKSPSFRRSYRVTGRVEDRYTFSLKIRIQESSRSCDIEFPFDLRSDSPQSVAEEMVRTLDYSESDLATIAELIREEIATLMPDMEGGRSIMHSPDKDSQGSSSELCHSNESISVISTSSLELSCKVDQMRNDGSTEWFFSCDDCETAEEETCGKASHDDCNGLKFPAPSENGEGMITVFSYEASSNIDESSEMATVEICRKGSDDGNCTEFPASSEGGESTTTVLTCEVKSNTDKASDSMDFFSEKEELSEEEQSILPEADPLTAEKNSSNSLFGTCHAEQGTFASNAMNNVMFDSLGLMSATNWNSSSDKDVDRALTNAAVDKIELGADDCDACRRGNRLVHCSGQSPPHCTSKARFKLLPAGIVFW